MFLKEVSSVHQGCIYLIKNTANLLQCFGIFILFYCIAFYCIASHFVAFKHLFMYFL